MTELLKQIRREFIKSMLDQSQLAAKAGYSVSMVDKVLNDRSGPSLKAKVKIARALGIDVDVDAVVREEEESERQSPNDFPAWASHLPEDLLQIGERRGNLYAALKELTPMYERLLDAADRFGVQDPLDLLNQMIEQFRPQGSVIGTIGTLHPNVTTANKLDEQNQKAAALDGHRLAEEKRRRRSGK